MNKVIIRAILIGIAFLVLLVAVTSVDAGQNKKVCFCHNVNHNPHTICTADIAKIKGHTFHVRNGEDSFGICPIQETEEPSPTNTPETSPSPSLSPEPSYNPSSEPSATPVVACNSHCDTDQECRDRDGSYICTPQHVCRLEEAPERQECNPRPSIFSTPTPEVYPVFGPQK